MPKPLNNDRALMAVNNLLIMKAPIAVHFRLGKSWQQRGLKLKFSAWSALKRSEKAQHLMLAML